MIQSARTYISIDTTSHIKNGTNLTLPYIKIDKDGKLIRENDTLIVAYVQSKMTPTTDSKGVSKLVRRYPFIEYQLDRSDVTGYFKGVEVRSSDSSSPTVYNVNPVRYIYYESANKTQTPIEGD